MLIPDTGSVLPDSCCHDTYLQVSRKSCDVGVWQPQIGISITICSLITCIITSFGSAVSFQNSVRHNLSLNKCFEKIENPNADGTNSRKGCLWALNPVKVKKMDEEIFKWNKKDPLAIKRAMVHPGKTCQCQERY